MHLDREDRVGLEPSRIDIELTTNQLQAAIKTASQQTLKPKSTPHPHGAL